MCTVIMVHTATSSSYRSVYRALILLGLALCLSSGYVSSVLIKSFCLHFFPFGELSLMGLALDVVD